jgi:NADH:ubiquinone oxidoreductase subunit 4 (subunit M)
MSASYPTTITRDDIKSKLGDIQGEAQEQVQGAKNQVLAVGLLVGLLFLIVAFLLGRRGGKRSSAIIEVRRG